MAAVLERTRPWSDVANLTAELQGWLHHSGWRGARRISLGEETAEHLRAFGIGEPDLATDTAVYIALWLLGNVWGGRDPMDDDLIGRRIGGDVPARTIRHYRQLYGRDAIWRFFDSLQQDLDIAALCRCDCGPPGRRHGGQDHADDGPCRLCACRRFTGRSRAAARQWLRMNHGMHAKDAPPARKRRRAA